jgi:tRNA-splicing ligase RtcB
MGTLGSGNHYLEVQYVSEVFDEKTAGAYDLHEGDAVISVHCGSRGLGHQIGTEFLREMATSAEEFGIVLPDLELACAPVNSELGVLSRRDAQTRLRRLAQHLQGRDPRH